jgi:hypothetical protein
MLAMSTTRWLVRTSCQTQFMPQVELPLLERSAVHTWQETGRGGRGVGGVGWVGGGGARQGMDCSAPAPMAAASRYVMRSQWPQPQRPKLLREQGRRGAGAA